MKIPRLISLLWALIGLTQGCQEKPREQVSLTLYSPKREKISKTILLSGKAEVVKKVIVLAPINGTISSIKVELGKKVAKGDPLFEYDRDELKVQVEDLRKGFLNQIANKKNSDLQMDGLKLGLKRARILYSKNIGSRREVEDAERQVMVQENSLMASAQEFADHDKALKKLTNIQTNPVVKSPIAGVVSSIWKENETFSPGAKVVENDKLMVVADTSVFVISGRVLESEVGLLKGDEPGHIMISAARGEPYNGKVKSVSHTPLIDPNSNLGTYPVTVQILDSDEKIQPGMAAQVEVILSTKENVIVVPINAIKNDQGVDSVDVIKNGMMSTRIIKLGLSNDVSAEVVEGLQENEAIRVP